MLFFLFLLTSCWKPAPSNQATATPTSMEPVPTSLPPVSTQQPVSIWIDPAFPYASGADLTLPDGYEISRTAEEAAIKLSAKADEPFTEQVFALAASFFTLTDGISAQQLMNLWQKGQAIPDGPDSLLVDDSAALGFEYLWGKPSSRVYPTNPNDMLSKAQRSKRTWVLIPFDQLDPAWKVIAIDGANPLWKEFDPSRYPLRLEFGWIGAEQTLEPLRKANPFPTTNRFRDHLTTVMVTGTTALVRGTGALMELHGMTYPAGDIGPWLQNADILHISNEIAFAKNCPPQSNWDGLAFCSQPRYIELLEEIGTDVVDLTGDHFADWSEQAMRDTLQMYATRGWLVFGGGENLEAGRQPALFEHNGNKIAFLGCNAKEIGYATATDTFPGAVHCEKSWLLPAIQAVKNQGYNPIVTFQHQEYYELIARPQLQADFRAAADAGAVIVSGSQAHMPHIMELYHDSFIHYGLGNLFFDQVFSMEYTGKAFIDRHVFYDNRHISTELLTIQFIDYARPRPMTEEERRDLLEKIFTAAGWRSN